METHDYDYAERVYLLKLTSIPPLLSFQCNYIYLTKKVAKHELFMPL